MARVALTRPEWELVDLAEGLVSEDDPVIRGALLARLAKPSGLNDEAVRHLEVRLVRGVALWLLRSGARELPALPPLVFGSATLDLLSWLRSVRVADPKRPSLQLRAAPTASETPLFVRAIAHLGVLGAHLPEAFAGMPWLWLFCGAPLTDSGHDPDLMLQHGGAEAWHADAWLLRSCPHRLREAWLQWSRRIRRVQGGALLSHGHGSAALASALFERFEHDPEAAGFLVDLLADWVQLPPAVWEVERGDQALTHWQRARQARVALLGVIVARARAWSAAWRQVGFVDDGYDEAQRLLRRFEPGLRAAERLSAVVAHAERLPEVPSTGGGP